MINIVRNPQVPGSLDNQTIKDYTAAAIQYLNNPSTISKPKKTSSYRNIDVLEAFDRDFYSKCYLTEQKLKNSWIMEVEHFIPQNERPDLVYEWTNLFPANHHVNIIKPKKTLDGGYLDPCDPTENVETEIFYALSFHDRKPSFEPRDPQYKKAVNTCVLLDRVHNGHDDNTKKITENLRSEISYKCSIIVSKILEWQACPDNSPEKNQAKQDLKGLLSRESSFTMLCRAMPEVVRYVPKDFLD